MHATTPRIVLDTNVLVTARRSARGASHRLLARINTGRFEVYVSTALLLEYQEVLLRQRHMLGLRTEEIEALLDSLAFATVHQDIYFRWGDYTRDVDDAHVLALAVAASAHYLVTYNDRDFPDVERAFGIRVVTAREFLEQIGDLP